MLRSKPDAGAVIQPEPTTLWLFLGNFQPFTSPDPRDPLLVHMPAVSPEQGGDATIAVATKPFGKGDDRFGKRLLTLSAARFLALGRTMLTEYLASPAF